LCASIEETDELSPEENEIIRIAWQAVNRRREDAKKRGEQLRIINGMNQDSGYAVYDDFNQYMGKKKLQKGLKASDWSLGRIRYKIRNTLLSKGWAASRHHPETRFYPPKDNDRSRHALMPL
jgi:hypothetical protein